MLKFITFLVIVVSFAIVITTGMLVMAAKAIAFTVVCLTIGWVLIKVSSFFKGK